MPRSNLAIHERLQSVLFFLFLPKLYRIFRESQKIKSQLNPQGINKWSWLLRWECKMEPETSCYSRIFMVQSQHHVRKEVPQQTVWLVNDCRKITTVTNIWFTIGHQKITRNGLHR
jgi:hypothetical protein